MSKVIAWFEGGNILKGDCGHFFETDVQVDTGAEVDCPVCAEKAADVKVARREGLAIEGRAWQILKQLLERAQPEEGQAWEILISELEYDTFKELIKSIDNLLVASSMERTSEYDQGYCYTCKKCGAEKYIDHRNYYPPVLCDICLEAK